MQSELRGADYKYMRVHAELQGGDYRNRLIQMKLIKIWQIDDETENMSFTDSWQPRTEG